jgi:hypothetical protein
MMQAAQCFNEEVWDKWSEVIRRDPRRFMNVDETKVTTDLDFVLKTTTVVAPATGIQPRTSVPVTSRESFTFVYVINAAGKVVLPSGAVIPRKTDITPRWFRDCQRQIDRSRVWVGAVSSGNFDSATFAEYMDVVLSGLRGPGKAFDAETDTYPLFVLLDQASVHMAISGADQKRTALGDVLVKHKTIAFYLPSGTTSASQPEDVSTNGAVKMAIADAVRCFATVVGHPVRKLGDNFTDTVPTAEAWRSLKLSAVDKTMEELREMFSERFNGYPKALNMATFILMADHAIATELETSKGQERIRGGFDATGWYPFDRLKVESLWQLEKFSWRDRLGPWTPERTAALLSRASGAAAAQPAAAAAAGPDTPPPLAVVLRSEVSKARCMTIVVPAESITPVAQLTQEARNAILGAEMLRELDRAGGDPSQLPAIAHRILDVGVETPGGVVMSPFSMAGLSPSRRRLTPLAWECLDSGARTRRQRTTEGGGRAQQWRSGDAMAVTPDMMRECVPRDAPAGGVNTESQTPRLQPPPIAQTPSHESREACPALRLQFEEPEPPSDDDDDSRQNVVTSPPRRRARDRAASTWQELRRRGQL